MEFDQTSRVKRVKKLREERQIGMEEAKAIVDGEDARYFLIHNDSRLLEMIVKRLWPHT